MTTQDTNEHAPAELEHAPAELVDVSPGVDPFGGLLGGLDIGAMFSALGVELPDADSTTLDDIADELDDLGAKVDWIARALLAVAANVPAKWRPDLPDYPGDL